MHTSTPFLQLETNYPFFANLMWNKDQQACLEILNSDPRLVLTLTGIIKKLTFTQMAEHENLVMFLSQLLERYAART